MPPAEPPAVQIERHIAARRWDEALRLADRLCVQDRGSPIGWIGRAKVHHLRGLQRQALDDIEQALRRGPGIPMALHLRAAIVYRLGRGDEAIEAMQGLLRDSTSVTPGVRLSLAEALERMGRFDDLRALFDGGWAWQQDAHAVALHNRLTAHDDPELGITRMLEYARGGAPIPLRRMAGFDAVRLLDRLGRYEEAYREALATHRMSSPPFDLASFLRPIHSQGRLLATGGAWCAPRAPTVERTATIVALPRSGTTLLEQMLDRHPAITGIGEYEGLRRLGQDLESAIAWPTGLPQLDGATAQDLQAAYLSGARATLRAGSSWTFDKTLHAWQWLPAISALLPGMVCLEIQRDPRDTAISILLSNFNPVSNGWTASLDTIRAVMTAQRDVVGRAIDALDLRCERIIYEDLVDDPAGHARRCLDRMGLPMADEVLQPEANRRAVLTLSNAQVRKPINRGSIGRWQNYAFAFDDSWDELDRAHQARRGGGTR